MGPKEYAGLLRLYEDSFVYKLEVERDISDREARKFYRSSGLYKRLLDETSKYWQLGTSRLVEMLIDEYDESRRSGEKPVNE